MKILIIGADGFIGCHLVDHILTKKPNWEIHTLDLSNNNLAEYQSHPKLFTTQGDMTKMSDWIEEKIKLCDVVLPLAAIATPATYVQDPLKIFSLDFEANLAIIRLCVKHSKRVIFPSTSEVYGMCTDSEFDEEKSHLILGPIHKERWIYSCSKQLIDRLIFAYGKRNGLPYTLFRPFNWIGPKQDNIKNSKTGGSRVVIQFLGNILRGENIQLVDGGRQHRSFVYVEDGIEALVKIIENTDNCASGRIFNIGNPHNISSIRSLAETLLELAQKYPQHEANAKKVQLMDIPAADYYGTGYQDVQARVPAIWRAQTHLQWQPKTDLITSLSKTVDYYLHDAS
ncbi:MAG: bifunctional UDP-4-keto-pentose/UDP-xylose synthase [Gammaproteobacteria bacterium]|nr:bifunctional UDP-4-keto-pentose/UDP-xylose synthase [Gammaproteobacteria bacterium]